MNRQALHAHSVVKRREACVLISFESLLSCFLPLWQFHHTDCKIWVLRLNQTHQMIETSAFASCNPYSSIDAACWKVEISTLGKKSDE